MPTACLDPDTVLGWLDGQLSSRQANQVESHIDGCADCRRLVCESQVKSMERMVASQLHLSLTRMLGRGKGKKVPGGTRAVTRAAR